MSVPRSISTRTPGAPDREVPPLILIVSGDAGTRASIASEMSGAGFRIVEAADGDQAGTRSQQEFPAVGIVDHDLGQTTGVELASALNAVRPVPIIVLSGHADSSVVLRALAAGVFLYLVRPLDPPRLVPIVRAALHHASMRGPASSTTTARDSASEERARSIGIATGLLMSRYGLTSTEAYHRLRRHARSQRIAVAEVASEILESSDRAFRHLSAAGAAAAEHGHAAGRADLRTSSRSSA